MKKLFFGLFVFTVACSVFGAGLTHSHSNLAERGVVSDAVKHQV